jgi:hypothetical protein
MRHDRQVVAGNTPFDRPLCRYVLSVTVGHISIEQPCQSLEAATGALDLFKAREAGNRDAYGGIYDRETRGYLGLWRGGPRLPKLPTVADIFAKLIAHAEAGRGAPVSVISDRGVVEVNARSGREA